MEPEVSDRHLRRDRIRRHHLAERAAPNDLIATQGHVLTVDDLLATLVVEATIHHLDITVDVDAPGPGRTPVEVTLSTLTRLLGRATPDTWSSYEEQL